MVAEKGHRFRQPLVHLPRGGLNITARGVFVPRAVYSYRARCICTARGVFVSRAVRCSRIARGEVIPRAVCSYREQCSRTACGEVIPRAACANQRNSDIILTTMCSGLHNFLWPANDHYDVAPALNNYCHSLIMIMWCGTSTDNNYNYYYQSDFTLP